MIGPAVIYAELHELVNVVDGIDWMVVHIYQARRGSRIQDDSPGSAASDGDFVWYDPYLKCLIDGDTERTSAKLPRLHAEDLRTGFVYVPEGIMAQRISSKHVAVEFLELLLWYPM